MLPNCLWSEEGVEIVIECTGKYRDAEEAKVHLEQPTVKKSIDFCTW